MGCSVNLTQAREISKLSRIPTDGCTLAPDFGVEPVCEMHDHNLGLFVTFKDSLNASQKEYMTSQGLDGYIAWSDSRGKTGIKVTRKQVDHLFREGLQEKVDSEDAWYKKLFYWNVRNTYYFFVTIYRRIKR